MKIIKVTDELHTQLKVGASKNDMSIKAFIQYLFTFEDELIEGLTPLGCVNDELSGGINAAIDFIKNNKEHDIDMAKTLVNPAPFGKVKVTGDIDGLTKDEKYAVTVDWGDFVEIVNDVGSAVKLKRDGSTLFL